MTCTLLEQAQASITIYSPPCKCGQGQLLAGEEDVEGTWINELGIWISVHTLTSSLGRGSGWRERGEWSQHLDPALIPAPALFPRSCPDFPSLLRRLHLNSAFCKTLKGAFVKMGGLLFISQLVGLIYHFQIIIPTVFGFAFVLMCPGSAAQRAWPLPSLRSDSFLVSPLDGSRNTGFLSNMIIT